MKSPRPRSFAPVFCLAALLPACTGGAPSPTDAGQSPLPASAAPLPPTPWKAAAIAHGGVGSPPDRSDGCRRAVDAALAVLEAGGEPTDAAVAGVVVLEDDPRFNAGTGSRVRIDGRTVQMDASIMDSSGRFAAVAAVEQVKNPVKVARAVMDTPHLLLAGDGATRFARTLGLAPYDPATDEGRKKARALQEQLLRNDPKLPDRWKTFDWRKHWNFETPLAEAGLSPTAEPAPSASASAPAPNTASPPGTSTAPAPSPPGSTDTVGVAVRAKDGRFAVALSTGGTSVTLRGRVGDVPVYGAGLFAGPRGASAATGEGERIIEAALAREVNTWLEQGASPEEAARRAVDAVVRKKGDIGIIVVGPASMAAAANLPMAWAGRESGSTTWMGP